MTIQKKLQLRSISYIHDPEAAQKWFQLYVEFLVEVMKQSNSMDKLD
ncbi:MULTISPECIES: hypothetical protein [Bacillus cereus group]|nr:MULTISPECIES: hypothetical protein [Bacillus cereus group]MCB5895960.1 hypothetical protein [Bacillus cereus]